MIYRFRIQSIVTTFLLIASFAVGQTSADNRVREAYGNEYTDQLENTNPERINYLNFLIDNSFYLIDAPAGKDYPLTSSFSKKTNHNGHAIPNITADNIATINVLLYSIDTNRKSRTFYKIDNSDKVIVFYSGDEIAKNFNETLDKR